MKALRTTDGSSGPAAAFDSAAVTYDETFDADPTTKRLRAELHTLIVSLTPPHGDILDMSCGTGTDAITLAQQGLIVTGVDISAGMLDHARRKVSGMERTPPRFFQTSLTSLASSGLGSFDLMYSNFGGLNCVEDLSPVADAVRSLLRPGGYLIAVVMPPVSPWEITAGLARLRPGYAFRRFRDGVESSGFGPEPFPVYYHRLRDLKRALRNACMLESSTGWNIITPPPDASGFPRRHPSMMRVLVRLETTLCRLPLLRSVGDHYAAVFRKHPAEAPAEPRGEQ